MQEHGGPAADTAILASQRRITPVLRFDWNRTGEFDHALSDMTGFVSEVSTDRALTSSAPEDIIMVEGSVAAELTATVGGEYDGLSLVEVFSEFNGKSPFYLTSLVGVPMSYSLEVDTGAYGLVEYPQFQGVVREIQPDRAENQVEISCLDRVEVLRQPVQFPKWAISLYHYSRGYIRAQLCDSQWVIDHCLRQCGVSPTPLRPTRREELNVPDDTADGVLFWLTGTGSHCPTVGWMDEAEIQSFPNTDGGGPEMFKFAAPEHPDVRGQGRSLAFNDLGNGSGVENRYWVSDRQLLDPSGTFYFTMTINTVGSTAHHNVNTGPINVRIGQGREMQVHVQNGQVRGEYLNPTLDPTWVGGGTWLSIPDGTNARVDVLLDNTSSTGSRASTTVTDLETGEETSTGWENIGPPFPGGGDRDDTKGLIKVRRRVSLTDIGFAVRNWFNAGTDMFSLHQPAEYPAALDGGLNRMSYTPEKDGDDAWDVITEVAGAEFGSVFWDEEGIFRFWNYDTVIGKQDQSVRTFTPDEFGNITPTSSLDTVRNVWSVETGRRTSAPGVVYESDDVEEFFIPAGTTKEFRLWVDDIQMVTPWRVTRYSNTSDSRYPQWNDNVTHGYVVQWFTEGRWWEEDHWVSGVEIRAYLDRDGWVVVWAKNGYSADARLVAGSQAAFRLGGTLMSDSPKQNVELVLADSRDRYGGRNIKLDGDWYQDQFQSANMLGSVAERSAEPIPSTDSIDIPGDPRLQLGDTVEVTDPDGIGQRFFAQIYQINRSWSVDEGLTDSLTVQIIRPPGESYWNDPQYAVWSETLIWG